MDHGSLRYPPVPQVTPHTHMFPLMSSYSWFPEKKKSFPSSGEETKYSGCSEGNLEDIPDDIMNATKSLVFKKEEETERINNEKQMKNMMANLQKQQNEILRLLRPFAEENSN